MLQWNKPRDRNMTVKSRFICAACSLNLNLDHISDTVCNRSGETSSALPLKLNLQEQNSNDLPTWLHASSSPAHRYNVYSGNCLQFYWFVLLQWVLIVRYWLLFKAWMKTFAGSGCSDVRSCCRTVKTIKMHKVFETFDRTKTSELHVRLCGNLTCIFLNVF